eukprot:1094889-Pelagomonas_calceolata.AAC.10
MIENLGFPYGFLSDKPMTPTLPTLVATSMPSCTATTCLFQLLHVHAPLPARHSCHTSYLIRQGTGLSSSLLIRTSIVPRLLCIAGGPSPQLQERPAAFLQHDLPTHACVQGLEECNS